MMTEFKLPMPMDTNHFFEGMNIEHRTLNIERRMEEN
jgi:hypothetical protein